MIGTNSGEIGYCLTASAQNSLDAETETLLAVAQTLRGEGFDASEDGTGRQNLVPVAIQERAVSENPNAGPDGAGIRQDGASYTLEARTVPQAVAFAPKAGGKQTTLGFSDDGACQTLGTTQEPAIVTPWAVRRLTPAECERLMGFPDGFTAIPWRGKPADQCPDGPRYKSLGNSMAVNCMEWIGERIAMVQSLNDQGPTFAGGALIFSAG